MEGFKFIHTADLHLDRPFLGIGQMDGLMRQSLVEATFQSFRNIVQLALEENVDFLVIAGDLYDGADLSLKAQLFCREEFRRLTEAGIQVYLAHGNHDHLRGWRADLDWPQGVFVFPAGEVDGYPIVRDGVELAHIYGISYPEQHVTENYLPKFQEVTQRKMKEKSRSLYRIGVLHTNVGSRAGYANYAPCTLRELIQSDFDYWALGHVHQYQVLHDGEPLIVYPGTPQGCHPGEMGAKGCCLVQVAGDGSTRQQWIEVDHLRWSELAVSIGREASELAELLVTLDQSLTDFHAHLKQQVGLVRIRILGRGPLHTQLKRPGVLEDLEESLREEWLAKSSAVEDGSTLWIESIQLETRPVIDIEARRTEETLLGDFLKLTKQGQELDPTILQELQQTLDPFFQDRRLSKYLSELDGQNWQRLIQKSEEEGLELFGLEVDGK